MGNGTRSAAQAGSALIALLLLAAAAPAASADGKIYHWRTEDGTYAFTDDPDAVPPRQP